MPHPMAICIEDLDTTSDAERYLRCVVLAGRQPGLGLNGRGEILWRSDRALTLELCVSMDDRLVLLRSADGEPVRVRRSERTLDVPADKPVVLLDGDHVEIGARRLRVHVHGEAPAVSSPAFLPVETRPTSFVRAAATALALGAAVGSAGCTKGVEVRDRPPVVAPVEQPDAGAGQARPDLRPPDTRAPDTRAPDSKKIEVRERPPIIVPPPEKPRTPTKK